LFVVIELNIYWRREISLIRTNHEYARFPDSFPARIVKIIGM